MLAPWWRSSGGTGTWVLLGRSGNKDVIDAAMVLLAGDGDEILTRDAEDLATLATAAGIQVDLVRV